MPQIIVSLATLGKRRTCLSNPTQAPEKNQEGEMARTHTIALVVLFVLAMPLAAETAVKHQAANDDSFHVTFSGNFSYTVGAGKAHMTLQDIFNSGTSTSGPLHVVLVFTPNGPFPNTGFVFTAQYDLAPLAAGAHYTNVDSGQVTFTDPGNGCWYVAIVLYEERTGDSAYIADDWGNFSLRLSSGQGCMFSFGGNPLTIAPGQSSTLTWSTGGTSATLDNGIGVQSPSGSISVSPSQTTTYTCSATGTADSTPRTAQVTITVAQPPPTATFSAAPTSIGAGQSSTLSWTSTNATTISIDNGVGSKPASGSTSVSPTQTTTYTLTATGPGGQITKTATVTIVPAPSVSFTATPASITAGQSSTLSWTTTNASNVSIDNGLGAQALSGSTGVAPTQTTTYTLTATGIGGTTTRQVTVTVTGGNITFNANPPTIALGSSATLTWNALNVTSVTIDNGIGQKPASGSVIVSPSQSTTYTLTAGASSASARVTVVPPPTVTLTATPSVIAPGGSTTLTWTSTNAITVAMDHGIGLVTPGGSMVVSPSSTTKYSITASGIGGQADSSVTVVVGAVGKRRAARH
jgi:uncharacterized cupredoxin-like copper-binding protein